MRSLFQISVRSEKQAMTCPAGTHHGGAVFCPYPSMALISFKSGGLGADKKLALLPIMALTTDVQKHGRRGWQPPSRPMAVAEPRWQGGKDS
jgi:hypothetical protein